MGNWGIGEIGRVSSVSPAGAHNQIRWRLQRRRGVLDVLLAARENGSSERMIRELSESEVVEGETLKLKPQAGQIIRLELLACIQPTD